MTDPSPVAGTSQFSSWLNRLLAFSKSNRILSGVGYRVRRAPAGTILEILPGAGGSTPQSSGMNFRGEFLGTANYKAGDVVVFREGPSAGSYVCVKDNPGSTHPPTFPDIGNGYWVSLGTGNTVGSWL